MRCIGRLFGLFLQVVDERVEDFAAGVLLHYPIDPFDEIRPPGLGEFLLKLFCERAAGEKSMRIIGQLQGLVRELLAQRVQVIDAGIESALRPKPSHAFDKMLRKDELSQNGLGHCDALVVHLVQDMDMGAEILMDRPDLFPSPGNVLGCEVQALGDHIEMFARAHQHEAFDRPRSFVIGNPQGFGVVLSDGRRCSP